MSTEELEVLQSLFPHYRLWLISGEVMPEAGQVSPDFEEASRNLAGQNAGQRLPQKQLNVGMPEGPEERSDDSEFKRDTTEGKGYYFHPPKLRKSA